MLPAREILLLGPYGVLGTGVVDAAAANPAWRVVTAARRPVPSHRDSTAVRHINVDLLDREGTREVLSKLGTVTDLVFAAYVEKPTMAETVDCGTVQGCAGKVVTINGRHWPGWPREGGTLVVARTSSGLRRCARWNASRPSGRELVR